MFKTASTIAVLAAIGAVSAFVAPAKAAVRIDTALELALPDFMPEPKQNIFVLNERAEWPIAVTGEQPAS